MAVNPTNNKPPLPGFMNQNVPAQIQMPQTLPIYHGYMNTQAYAPNPIYSTNQQQFIPLWRTKQWREQRPRPRMWTWRGAYIPATANEQHKSKQANILNKSESAI